jgi:hypothetical protein
MGGGGGGGGKIAVHLNELEEVRREEVRRLDVKR